MKKYIGFAVTALAFNLGGCATVINGTKTSYVASSEPSGASVRFSNGQSCTTPCTLEKFRRKDDLRADMTMPGYKPTYVLIQSRLGGGTFGNLLLGGIVGGVVDAGNGASNRLYPKPLIVRLAPVGSEGGAMLLDKNGKVVKSVKEYNDSVRADVAKKLGRERAGFGSSDPQ